MASGQLLQMTENRKKNEAVLKSDYANTDKLFKEQLIKTKVISSCDTKAGVAKLIEADQRVR